MGHRLLPNRPWLYHGKNSSRPYFEGWYFKQTGQKTICVIPGVHRGIKPEEDIAFIQFISPEGKSFFFSFPYDTFRYNKKSFEIWIYNSFFSLEKISLNILNDEEHIEGVLYNSGLVPLKKTIYSPSIMGPFSYLPHMQCNHGVLSLTHKVSGVIKHNGVQYIFDNAAGYIEKDWGEAFPEHWIWMQCSDKDSSLMCSIAKIPYGNVSFTGLICVLLADGKQYRFATYNRAKIKSLTRHDNNIRAEIERGQTSLLIDAKSYGFCSLKAPTVTGMNRDIDESNNTDYDIKLFFNGKIIFFRSYKNGGLEMLNPERLLQKN